MNMIGHNSLAGEKHAALNALGRGIQEARSLAANHKERMVVNARLLVEVDRLAADNEEVADQWIKEAKILLPSDLIANPHERAAARWLAHGGIVRARENLGFSTPKTLSEINDLDGPLTVPEGWFLGPDRTFAKTTRYDGIRRIVTGQCKGKIKAAFGDEALLDAVRVEYADTLFKADTVEDWIKEEEYRRSDEYARIQNLKKAWAMRVAEAIEEAKKASGMEPFDRLEAQVKKQLDHIHKLAAQKRAEEEAKAAAKAADEKLTLKQRRDREYARKSLAGGDASMGQDYVEPEEEASDD